MGKSALSKPLVVFDRKGKQRHVAGVLKQPWLPVPLYARSVEEESNEALANT